MHWLAVWYFRFVSRQWRRPVELGRSAGCESGAWNRRIGDLGEALARDWMWAHGKKVLFRRYRARGGGEVDIIARDGETLVFCEVKTRVASPFARPAAAVDREKQVLITRGANSWLRELGYVPVLIRFDIIEVILEDGEIPRINHLENAFNSTPRIPI